MEDNRAENRPQSGIQTREQEGRTASARGNGQKQRGREYAEAQSRAQGSRYAGVQSRERGSGYTGAQNFAQSRERGGRYTGGQSRERGGGYAGGQSRERGGGYAGGQSRERGGRSTGNQGHVQGREYAGGQNRGQGMPRNRAGMPLSEEEYRRERARRRRERLIRRRRKVLLGLTAATVILLYGITNLILYGVVSRYPKDVICKNIYIGAVDVSGMSKKEAKAAIEDQLEKDRAKSVSVEFGGKSEKGKLEEFGLKYTGVDKVVDQAMNYGKKGSLWSRFWKLRKTSKKLVLQDQRAIDKEAGAAAVSVHSDALTDRAKNATITKKGSEFKIKKEQDGETINTEDFLKKLERHLNDNWNHKEILIKGKAEKEKAAVTSEDLASVKDELSSFSTDAGSGERVQNLKTGVEKVNGTVLMPGEVFSMEEKTKPYTEENGYVLGGSYEGGRVVESYGGGICQVSTTLYNAVIYAELEIVERYPHSMLVDYVSPSRDAAIAEGLLDFKFKNNYDTPVYINGGIDDSNQLYFEIYGKDTREKGRTIEFESEVLSTEEPGTTYEEDSELPFGQIEAVSGAHTGTEAKLWKIIYQDGEQVSREEFNSSSYQKADTIYAVGTQTDDADAAARVREAIATQDETQIYAAIGGTQ